MALSESIKQIAIFDECIYHLFSSQFIEIKPQGKCLLFALLNKANIHPNMLKDSSEESEKGERKGPVAMHDYLIATFHSATVMNDEEKHPNHLMQT